MVFGFWEFQGLTLQLCALAPKPASAALASRMQDADATGQDPSATLPQLLSGRPCSGPSQFLGSLCLGALSSALLVAHPSPQRALLAPVTGPAAHLLAPPQTQSPLFTICWAPRKSALPGTAQNLVLLVPNSSLCPRGWKSTYSGLAQ